MIIIKTNMTEIPNSCKECDISSKAYGNVMCGVLKNWLETWEIRSGKVKLDNCPLEKGEK